MHIFSQKAGQHMHQHMHCTGGSILEHIHMHCTGGSILEPIHIFSELHCAYTCLSICILCQTSNPAQKSAVALNIKYGVYLE